MEKITNMLLAILFAIGVLVAITFMFASFISYAIVIWTIVVITVFTAFIYEIFD
jgi:hypothetical protein